MKHKAIITIEPNQHYDASHKGGMKYTSVSLRGHNYGGGSPCDNNDEVEKAIEHFKEWAKREGDTFEVIDKRDKQASLSNFFGEQK